jgi:hypothetical protein
VTDLLSGLAAQHRDQLDHLAGIHLVHVDAVGAVDEQMDVGDAEIVWIPKNSGAPGM